MQTESQSNVKARKTHTDFLITLVVLLLVAGGFAWYAVSTSRRMSAKVNEAAELSLQVRRLEVQVSNGGSDVSGLQNEVISLRSNLEGAQAQLSSLEKIVSLSLSSTPANSVTINQSAGQSTQVTSFTAQYAGYIVVSGTTTTTKGFIRVSGTFAGYPGYTQDFASGATLVIPVLPGTVTVHFGNNNALNGASATISVKYYY